MDKRKMKNEKRGVVPPPGMGQTKQTVRQHNKRNTTKSERKGQENRSATKAPLRQPQQFVVRVAQAGSTYVVGVVLYFPCLPSPLCFSVSRVLPTIAATSPLPIPLDTTRNGSAAHPFSFASSSCETRATENESKK